VGRNYDRLTEPIVTKAKSLAEEPVRGNPDITKLTHFADFAGGYLVGVSVAKHPAGKECGAHNHRGAHELFYVVKGTGVITVGEAHYEVGPGDSVLVPVRQTHNLRGAGVDEDDVFEVLCAFVVAPGNEWDPEPWKPL
jgi:mannose-6-phosphate isomerase-like protein (cupin superfamily)